MKTRGFTLIEILLAVVIFSFVATAAYATLSASRTAQARAEQRCERFQIGRTVLEIIARDVKGILSSQSVYDAGLRGEDHDRQDAISFYSLANRPRPERSGESDLMRVRYFLAAGDRNRQAGLYRATVKLLTALYAAEEDLYRTEILAPEIAGLNFRYFDGSTWRDSFDSVQSGEMPTAVEISLDVRTGGADEPETQPFRTVVTLPVEQIDFNSQKSGAKK